MTANAKNLSTLANVLDDGTNGQLLQSTGSGGIVFADVAAGASVYDSAELLPLSGNDAGDMAYVNSTNRFYINNGTGWYSISLVNTNPNITSVQDASASTTPFSLATDGTATVITITANDPEGIPLTYNYSVTSGSLTNGGGTTATVTQSDNVFTVTPSTTEAYAGTFDLTFTASDGINTATNANSFTLSFSENAYYIDPRDHGMITGSFAGCGINSNDVSLYVLGYSGDQSVYKWDLGTPAELASIPNTYTQRASITNGTPAGFYINQAGTYYYYMSYGNVYQVSLSTANDLTTGTETSAWQTTSGQAFNNSGLIFGGTLSHTGHKLYISETNTNNIHEYPLNTNWDISTAQNRTNSFNPNNITYAFGMGWSTDGMKLWAGEYRYVREYSASSAYSLSGMSTTPSASFDIQDLNGNVTNGVSDLANQEIRGIAVSSDGNRLYLNIRSKGVYKLTMTTQNTIANGFDLG